MITGSLLPCSQLNYQHPTPLISQDLPDFGSQLLLMNRYFDLVFLTH